MYTKCEVCGINFNTNKIGDAVAWITSFLLSFFSLPLAIFLDYKFQLTLIQLSFVMALIILMFTIFLLRIITYLFVKRMMSVE